MEARAKPDELRTAEDRRVLHEHDELAFPHIRYDGVLGAWTCKINGSVNVATGSTIAEAFGNWWRGKFHPGGTH